MDRIRTSLDGFKNIVANAIAFVSGAGEGANDDISYSSSCEQVDCKSDCSVCDSNNRSISMASSKHSVIREGRAVLIINDNKENIMCHT